MKITKLELKNFKRFTDLTIDMTSLANAPKLVLLIGTNGSGKSSVFDAFEVLNKISKKAGLDFQDSYYKKYEGKRIEIRAVWNDSVGNAKTISLESRIGAGENSFYGRSSVRQVPKLTRTSLGVQNISFEKDSDRPNTFIDRDSRFENDIEKVTSLILTDVFKGNISTTEIKENYINPINRSFENVFGVDIDTRIILISIKPPLEGKTAEILFEKGSSLIPYDFLSSGEKEIFNILLNLLTRRDYFQDSIYFLDEIDLHLNTQLQKNLLKEITENWIPDNCQLWTASHSLGFIEYANEAEHAAIIDFDNLNFDVSQLLKPSPKTSFDVFEIAVSKEFLSRVFEGKKIVFSENTDTSLYNNLNIKDTIFFNAKDKLDVFHKALNNPAYNGLIDRDYLTDQERIDLLLQYNNLYILEYYSIENYLYHPNNLESYFALNSTIFDKQSYIVAIENEKRKIRDEILMGVSGARSGYPFYRENNKSNQLKTFKSGEQSSAIMKMFDSPDFETYYKVFPAKDYGSEISQRQNLNKADLAKTTWFKNKIENVIKP